MRRRKQVAQIAAGAWRRYCADAGWEDDRDEYDGGGWPWEDDPDWEPPDGWQEPEHISEAIEYMTHEEKLTWFEWLAEELDLTIHEIFEMAGSP